MLKFWYGTCIVLLAINLTIVTWLAFTVKNFADKHPDAPLLPFNAVEKDALRHAVYGDRPRSPEGVVGFGVIAEAARIGAR